MGNADNDSAVGAVSPSLPRQEDGPKDRLHVVRGNDRRRKEPALVDHEAEVQSREKSATAREDAALLREDAALLREDASNLREVAARVREGEAYLREGIAAAREQAMRTVEAGQAGSDEHMAKLREANSHLVTATIEAYKLAEQVQAAQVQLDHLARHDVLTDLPNRLLLNDRLAQAIALARRQGKQLALMFLDLDRFKYINDSLGHTVGDQLLQLVAKRLTACVRSSDTVCRQGGDEFVILLADIEHTADAGLSAQKILTALVVPYFVNQHELDVTVSIGISIFPNDGQDADTLIKNADTAMYHAKASGRNNFQFFEQRMSILAVERHSIEVGLRRALERCEFVLYYQPKINLHSNKIVGVEALIRWQHPERGLLLPGDFISIAEDSGLILPIGRWVLREASSQAQVWRQAGLPPVTIAVNTSALEFGAKGFVENIRRTLEETGLEPCHLELELTESVLMRDAESSNFLLHMLADLGVRVAVDDFGTGYSSLSYLKQFPIDTLKIDQSFVNDITSDPDGAAIVGAVTSMGKSLNLCVIAEGVETPEQRAFLVAQHCDEGQGYYFGRPMPPEALAALLKKGLPAPPL